MRQKVIGILESLRGEEALNRHWHPSFPGAHLAPRGRLPSVVGRG